jgi:hypothetical protein
MATGIRETLEQIPWRSRLLWQRIAFTLTAAWMIGVLGITGEDVHHPLFQYIFIVPLVLWSAGLVIGRVVARLWPAPPSPPAPPEGRRDPRRRGRPPSSQ